MHYSDRRRAKVAIGLELQSRGWTLYGFSEDKSDAMTDYFAPASWQGIAERDGYVVVVDVSAGNRWVLSRSGGFDSSVSTAGSECPRCSGSGEEPGGWTLVNARSDPRTFNLDRLKREGSQAVPMLPDVVSPVYFDLNGREKCIRCHGRGEMPASKTVHVDWPTFQANPPNTLWHAERGSRILESGIGLGPCADYDKERASAAVKRIVDRIEAATRRRDGTGEPAATPTTDVEGVTIRRNLARAGIEVIFPTKPDEEIRRKLGNKSRGGLGFRWSRHQGLWYARYTPALWQGVHRLLGVDDVDGEPAVVLANGDTDEEGDDIEPGHPLLDHAVVCLVSPTQVEPCSVDVHGVTWIRHHYDDCRDVAWKAEAEGRCTCTIRGDYSGFNQGNAPFWHVLYVDTSREHPEPSSWNGQGGILAGIDDGDNDPPTRLLEAATELLKLGYPDDLVVDGITWSCETGQDGRLRYTAERDPWYRCTLIGRPGDWKARWMKPGDLSTTRCFTDEEHAELEGEQNPLTIIETLTRYIRLGGPPPRVTVSCADVVPRAAGGWDYYPIVRDEADADHVERVSDALDTELVRAHGGTTAYQYSLF